MSQQKNFTIRFTILSLVLLLISSLIYFFVPAIKITPMYAPIIVFLYLISLFLFKMSYKAMHSKISLFANTVMISNFGKLILFSAIIVVYALSFKNDAISFTLSFFVFYIIFTTFEIFSLLRLKK